MAEGPRPAEAEGRGRRGPELTCQPRRAGGKGQGCGRRRGGGGGRRGREGNGGGEQPGAALRQRRARRLSGPRGDIRRWAEATRGSRSPPRRHGDRARPAPPSAPCRAGRSGPCGADGLCGCVGPSSARCLSPLSGAGANGCPSASGEMCIKHYWDALVFGREMPDP